MLLDTKTRTYKQQERLGPCQEIEMLLVREWEMHIHPYNLQVKWPDFMRKIKPLNEIQKKILCDRFAEM